MFDTDYSRRSLTDLLGLAEILLAEDEVIEEVLETLADIDYWNGR